MRQKEEISYKWSADFRKERALVYSLPTGFKLQRLSTDDTSRQSLKCRPWGLLICNSWTPDKL